jgi:hypothetical protein
MRSSRAPPSPSPSNERVTRQSLNKKSSGLLPPAHLHVLPPPSKQPSNRYHATPKNCVVTTASRRSQRFSSLTKASVDNNSTVTSMDKDDDPQDLSQNLLDDKITKELIFTGADDNSISTTLVVKKPRLSNLTEELSITNSVQTSIPPGGRGFPKASDSTSTDLGCAALEFCRNAGKELQGITTTCICINCNFTAHLDCADQLFLQVPAKDGGVDYASNLSLDGKDRLKKFKGDRENVMLCFLCINAIKTKLQRNDAVGQIIPKKAKKPTYEAMVKKIKEELRQLAIFHALEYVFRGETKSNVEKMKALSDALHGTTETKGTGQQLIDGDGPFRYLYETVEGLSGEEQVLKHVFCCGATALSLVVGRDIVLSDIIKGKKQTDTTLWKHATSTLKTCKKAMTLLPWLSPKMVQLDNTLTGTAESASHQALHQQYIEREI